MVYLFQADYAKAIDYNQKSLVLARKIKDRSGEWRSLYRIGLALSRSSKSTEAETLFLNSIRVLESLRQGLSDTDKVSIADTQSDSYKLLQAVLLIQNKVEAALQISERVIARAFQGQLAKRLQTTDQSIFVPFQMTALRQVSQDQKALWLSILSSTISNCSFG